MYAIEYLVLLNKSLKLREDSVGFFIDWQESTSPALIMSIEVKWALVEVKSSIDVVKSIDVFVTLSTVTETTGASFEPVVNTVLSTVSVYVPLISFNVYVYVTTIL